MSNAIRLWTIGLNNYPGWLEWKRKQIGYTLRFDDPSFRADGYPAEFKFSEEIDRQHAIVSQYLGLIDTINALKNCEYYFRRYPFRGLPVTRYDHSINVCEMYFGRFYEFKERLKNYLGAITRAAPENGFDAGALVRCFQNEFEQELRERNTIHHRRRFEDLALDRVFLTSTMVPQAEVWKRQHLAAYRQFAREWTQRVRRRVAKMEEFLEVIAGMTLANCRFLTSEL